MLQSPHDFRVSTPASARTNRVRWPWLACFMRLLAGALVFSLLGLGLALARDEFLEGLRSRGHVSLAVTFGVTLLGLFAGHWVRTGVCGLLEMGGLARHPANREFLEHVRAMVLAQSEGRAPDVMPDVYGWGAHYRPRTHCIGLPMQARKLSPDALRALVRHEVEHANQAQRQEAGRPAMRWPRAGTFMTAELGRRWWGKGALELYRAGDLLEECEADACALREVGKDWRWYRSWFDEMNEVFEWKTEGLCAVPAMVARRRFLQHLAHTQEPDVSIGVPDNQAMTMLAQEGRAAAGPSQQALAPRYGTGLTGRARPKRKRRPQRVGVDE